MAVLPARWYKHGLSIFLTLLFGTALCSLSLYGIPWIPHNGGLEIMRTKSLDIVPNFHSNEPLEIEKPQAVILEPRFKHPIKILQHVCHCYPDDLLELVDQSLEQHRRCAEVYGYVYEVTDGQWVRAPAGTSEAYMNKVFVLMKVILEELEREDGVEWIMLVDTDTLIIDPSVNLHDMLPPRDTDPDPVLIAAKDPNGYNAGVTFWRVSHHALTILGRMIAVEHAAVDPSSSDQPLPQYVPPGRVPSDQYLIQILLRNFRDVREHFYEMPQDWFNSYSHPIQFPVMEPTDGGMKVRGHIHMAGPIKHDWDWTKFFNMPDEVYQKAQAIRDGMEGAEMSLDEALMSMQSAKDAREEAAMWWGKTKNGIDTMTWNEI